MNKINKAILILLLIGLSTMFASCAQTKRIPMVPKATQMKSIAELATMECYFHNVAKYKKENASGILFWKKDKHFWIEYSGIVKIGIDVERLKIEVNDDKVTIQIPQAKVLGHKVDEATLSKDSFIVEKGSAAVTAEDETLAFAEAQQNMVIAAEQDTALMESAKQRVIKLLEDYVMNIGKITSRNYSIEWVYLADEDKTEISDPSLETP